MNIMFREKIQQHQPVWILVSDSIPEISQVGKSGVIKAYKKFNSIKTIQEKFLILTWFNLVSRNYYPKRIFLKS